MGKVLYATGLIQGGTAEIEESMSKGISVKVVQSISECFTELEENASEYSFCLLCIKSFYNTDGRTEDALFSDLQLTVSQNKHIQFCFIDQDKGLQPRFSMSLAPLKNIKYTSATKLTLRTFNTILERFLEGTNKPKQEQKQVTVDIPAQPVRNQEQKPVVVKEKVIPVKEVAEEPVIHVRKEHVIELTEEIEQPKIAEKPKVVEEIPVVKEPQVVETQKVVEQGIAEEVMQELYGREISEPVAPPAKKRTMQFFSKKEVKKPVVVEQPQPPKQKQKEVPVIAHTKKVSVNRNPLKDFVGKSFLFTQASTCGATTVALMVARILARTGMTVCYVEATRGYASSNTIIDTDFYTVTGNNENNNLDMFIKESVADITKCFEVCEDIHILRNNAVQPMTERDITLLGKQLSRMFDVVVYDVSMEILRENMLFMLPCSFKFIVTSNDYTDIMKLAIELTRQQENYYDLQSIGLFCDSICREFKLVVSRYTELDGKSRRKLSWRDITEEIANTNEDLKDIEMADVAAIIPESISISQNLFAVESLKHATQILEGLI